MLLPVDNGKPERIAVCVTSARSIAKSRVDGSPAFGVFVWVIVFASPPPVNVGTSEIPAGKVPSPGEIRILRRTIPFTDRRHVCIGNPHPFTLRSYLADTSACNLNQKTKRIID